MFHVMLVLPGLILVMVIMLAIAAIIFFGIVAVIAAIAGGVSISLLIKDKTAKTLFFIGVGILFLIGLLCLLPIGPMAYGLSLLVFDLLFTLGCAGVVALSIFGFITSNKINNKTSKILLKILFCCILTVASLVLLLTFLALFVLLTQTSHIGTYSSAKFELLTNVL